MDALDEGTLPIVLIRFAQISAVCLVDPKIADFSVPVTTLQSILKRLACSWVGAVNVADVSPIFQEPVTPGPLLVAAKSPSVCIVAWFSDRSSTLRHKDAMISAPVRFLTRSAM
jgi:hypothetical protein